MPLVRVIRRELFRTKFTAERLLSRVISQMSFVVVLLGEGFVALRALEQIRLRMNFHVSVQFKLGGVLVRANGTHHLMFTVNQFMCIQFTGSVKLLRAN